MGAFDPPRAALGVMQDTQRERLRCAFAPLERSVVTRARASSPIYRSLAWARVTGRPFSRLPFLGLTTFGCVMLTLLVREGTVIKAGLFVFHGLTLAHSARLCGHTQEQGAPDRPTRLA
jgi:hypothetical protein